VTVAFRPSEVPTATPLVLADAGRLSRLEEHEVARRRATGGTVIALDGPDQAPPSERTVDAHFPAERRALLLTAPVPVFAVVRTSPETVEVHLTTSWPERASRARLRLPVAALRGARQGAFRTSDGAEVKLRFGRAGEALTAELPAFSGYAVLTPET
jgi:hypothetical protein